MPNQSDRGSASKFDGLIAFYPSPPAGDPWGEERERTAQRLSELGLDAGDAGVLDSVTEDDPQACSNDDSSFAADSGEDISTTDHEGDATDAEEERMLLRMGANGF
jgi:hypothetical protein